MVPTTNTSVWLGMPNWLEAANRAPWWGEAGRADGERAAPGPEPVTQRTWTAPSGATLKVSVWLGTPNCGEVTTGVGVGAWGALNSITWPSVPTSTLLPSAAATLNLMTVPIGADHNNWSLPLTGTGLYARSWPLRSMSQRVADPGVCPFEVMIGGPDPGPNCSLDVPATVKAPVGLTWYARNGPGFGESPA